jgi:hypothetical protein
LNIVDLSNITIVTEGVETVEESENTHENGLYLSIGVLSSSTFGNYLIAKNSSPKAFVLLQY